MILDLFKNLKFSIKMIKIHFFHKSIYRNNFIEFHETSIIVMICFIIDSQSELIDTIFNVCQTNPASPGLMLEDIQIKECFAITDQLVGLGNVKMDDLFVAADVNDDGIVMRSEVNEAFQSLALKRSPNLYSCPTCQ